MRAFIGALYANPTAKVRVNGQLSDTFSIHNGTRQGCPLPPLLYILTLELLLRCIRAYPNIKGIEVHQREYKVDAFSDDIFFFPSYPLTSLPNLMPVLEQLKIISNLKINYSKSFALNILLPPKLVQLCQTNFPFCWKMDTVTYLGIQRPGKLKDLYEDSYCL